MTDSRDADWYRRVLDAMADIVFVKDASSQFVWANQSALESFEMTLEQLARAVETSKADPDDTAGWIRDDYKVLRSGQTLRIPRDAAVNATGNVNYFDTVKSPLRDEDGRIIGLVGVARAIEDEASLAASARERGEWKVHLGELRTLVRDMPLPVAMLDAHLRFLAHSEAWLALLEYDGPDLAGQCHTDLFESALPLRAAVAEAMAGPRSVSIAEAVIDAGGGRLIANVEIRPWRAPSGDMGGAIVLVQDVTALIEANRALQRLNDELLQFNYRTSHDLLAPLKTVAGFLDLCDEELAAGNVDEVRAFHATIRDNVDRLAALVEDLLDLARADALNHEPTRVDVGRLVAESVDRHARDSAAAGVAVTVRCGAEAVYTERVRIVQIVDNLVSNAIKFHDAGKAERWVEVAAQVAGGELVVSVRDNGIGFDDSEREAMFRIFTRGTSKHAGSGLGLYLVSKHVSHLGGRVAVVSSREPTGIEVRVPVSVAPGPDTEDAGREDAGDAAAGGAA